MKAPIVQLIEFLQDPLWQNKLATSPYNIRIKKHPDYPLYLFNYNMVDTDFSKGLCLASRGTILDIPEHGKATVVCHAMDKFFNYGEKHAATLDWDSVGIYEKVDGSLLKYYYNPYTDSMQWATNKSFDCEAWLPGKEYVGCPYTSFQDLIDAVIAKNPSDFWTSKIKHVTFFFELTSHWNKVVIDYPENITLLGARDNFTHQELTPEETKARFNIPLDIPNKFSIENKSIEEVQAFVKTFNRDHEGIVLVDKNFNRLKMKGDQYLQLHRLKGQSGTLSTEDEIWNAFQQSMLDDIYANFPELAPAINKHLDNVKKVMSFFDETFDKYRKLLPKDGSKESRKDYALAVMEDPMAKSVKRFLFEMIDNPDLTKDYAIKRMKYVEFKQLIEQLIKQ